MTGSATTRRPKEETMSTNANTLASSPQPLASSRPLKLGIFISAIAGGMRDGALGWHDLSEMARTAEAVGFDSFWIPDHLIFKNEGEAPHGPWECWSLLAALAASTTRLDLGTAVTCVGFRNPALLAKMADTVDEISNGRLILGLGAGWHEPEYRVFDLPFDHRFERFDEACTIVKTLLREGAIDFAGTYYSARDCELRPRGPRKSGPPIMIGALASKPRMLRLVAKHADWWNGWLLHARSHVDEVPPLHAAVESACTAVDRDPATLVRTIGIGIDQRPPSARPPHVAGTPEFLTGTSEEIAAHLRAFAGAGISHLQITPRIQGVAGIAAFAPVLELLD
jgi:alkanesulfonate monooxygenase SsuD/methylene tetrahydromethanopterin reductase-like flavin-dependent oxidoreductase (luciferase family)